MDEGYPRWMVARRGVFHGKISLFLTVTTSILTICRHNGDG